MSYATGSKLPAKIVTDPGVKGNMTASNGETLREAGFDLAVNIAAEDTADGSDAGTTQALANALKVKVNALLTALKAAGFMVADE